MPTAAVSISTQSLASASPTAWIIVVERLITARQTRLELASDLSAVPIYLAIGVKHLLLGYGHILFLLMLLYLVRTSIAILKVVTSFTVAHSFTLAPSASHRYPVAIAFAFGLLHGLGFAGALAEIGLPQASRLMALLFLNLGIESGQLLVVAVVLILLASVKVNTNCLSYELPIYLTGGVASFWFLQRSWLIFIPVFN